MPVWELVFVLALILLNGFFAMSELAVVSARRSALARRARERRHGATAAARIAEDPSQFLSTVQIGITLVGVFAGAFGGARLAGPLGALLERVPVLVTFANELAMALVVGSITFLSLVIGELVPKRIALAHPEAIASATAPFMRRLSQLSAPLVWLLTSTTNLVLRLFGQSRPAPEVVSEDEVRALIAEGARTGVFLPTEHELIEGVLRIADRSVRAIMVPRQDVVWIDLDDPVEVTRKKIVDSGFSRFPVARDELDDFLGVVQTKVLLEQLMGGRELDFRAASQPANVVPDSIGILGLLEHFRESGLQMALVVDEYGGVEGIVTLHDILTGVAGAFREPGQAAPPEAVRRHDGSWLMDGRLSIDKVESLLELGDMRASGDFDTLAGFVLAELDRVPQTGEHFYWKGARFEVVDMDGARIDELLVYPPPASTPEDQTEAAPD